MSRGQPILPKAPRRTGEPSPAVEGVSAPGLGLSLLPVLFLMVFLGLAVTDRNALPPLPWLDPLLEAVAAIPLLGGLLEQGLPVHIPLVAATAVASLIAWRIGIPWREVERSYVAGISLALHACLILLVVGMLIGSWIASGVVPTMIFYGLKLLNPSYFLVAACLICAVVSLASGSSWTTAGTVGIALIGVGSGLGIPLPMVAGAIISGAYFGDKMSPLSDTTNLAPAVAGTELFLHVRHMLSTTGPSFALALLLYGLLGLRYGGSAGDVGGLNAMVEALDSHFQITPWLFLPPLLVVGLVLLRVPALPALIAGALVGGICAVVAQGASLVEVMTSAHSGYASSTGISSVDELLSRGGLISMLPTVAIIILAMSFGGVMERSGMLGVLAGSILRFARSTGSLVTATVATCIGTNIVAPDQYLSIVVPGRMYRHAYAQAGLHPKNLSRCLEDAGTLTSPLIPWNTCGAYMFATLGVFPLAYLPFAFLNLLNPIISIVYGFTGISMARLPPEDVRRDVPEASDRAV